jgi:hypothetical protein
MNTIFVQLLMEYEKGSQLATPYIINFSSFKSSIIMYSKNPMNAPLSSYFLFMAFHLVLKQYEGVSIISETGAAISTAVLVA